jgi:hypothetical protein
MSVFKNVYFHKLNVYKRQFVKGSKKSADTLKKLYQPDKVIKTLFDDILTNKLTNNCFEINDDGTIYTFEVLKFDNNYIFGKLGKYKDLMTVQLRDRKTFIPAQIQKTTTQDLEIFTYLLIDRNNYLISYLKEQSAPTIQVFSSIIDNIYGRTKRYFGEVSSVMIDDAIPILKKKKQIGAISYKVSIPASEKMNLDLLGISEKEFEMLQNQKSVDFEVKLVAERNKSALKDSNGIDKFLKKILKKTKKVKVKAKNENEYMQTYNIVDSIMTKREKFDFNKDATNLESEIYAKLKITYEGNKVEILEYVNRE